MDDAALWEAFVTLALPAAEWTHRAHLRVAWMHLARWPLLDEAHLRVRIGIVRLNAAHGLEETPARGYHETMTRAWLAMISSARATDRALDSPSFLERNPRLLEKHALLHHYTRDRILSLEARAVFLSPDLEPF